MRLVMAIKALSLTIAFEIAIVAVCVRADYTLEALFFRYQNPTHTRADGLCCDGSGVGACGTSDPRDACDNLFRICLNEEETDCEERLPFVPEQETTVVMPDNDDLLFMRGDDGFLGLPNPLVFNVPGPWPSNPPRQLTVVLYDDDAGSFELIGKHIAPLALSPGTLTGPVQYNSTTPGPSFRPSLTLSLSLQCAENFYGVDCSRVCVDTDSELGRYTCDSQGFIVCSEGYRNTSTNCNECIPADGCSAEAGGYCEGPGDCFCLPGYTGALCDIDMRLDLCGHTMPCQNGATCMNSEDGGFDCTCTEEFEGERCQSVRTDECDPDPCQNGATCVDLLANYLCMCSNGFTGRNCTEEEEETNGSQSGSGGVPVVVLAGGVGGTAVAILLTVTLVILLVVVWRRKKSSAAILKLQVVQDVDPKANEAYGIDSAPIPLTDNEAYNCKSVQHNGSPDDDEGYVINQLTYDLPHSEATATVATAPNVAYGGLQPPTANQATTPTSLTEDDEGYVIDQLTYDLPHTEAATASISMAPNAAYGGLCASPVADDQDTYEYIT